MNKLLTNVQFKYNTLNDNYHTYAEFKHHNDSEDCPD